MATSNGSSNSNSPKSNVVTVQINPADLVFLPSPTPLDITRTQKVALRFDLENQIYSGIKIPIDAKDSFMQKEGPVRQALAQRPHAAIVNVLCSYEDSEGNGCLIFEKVKQDLFFYVKQRVRLNENEAKFIFKYVVSAVAHCHSLHIVLRDIKLGKIMFFEDTMKDSPVAIVDLDGSEICPEDGIVRDQRGSPAYVAPEVLLGGAYDAYKADMWSLGVVLFVMVSGRYPFQDPRPVSLAQAIFSASIEYSDDLSPDCVNLLKALLNRDVDTRIAARAALQHPWFSNVPKSMPPPPSTAPMPTIRYSNSVDQIASRDVGEHLRPLLEPEFASDAYLSKPFDLDKEQEVPTPGTANAPPSVLQA